VLVGGEPLRLVRLSEEGARRLDEGDEAVLARLVDSGLAHPAPQASAPPDAEMAVVIPVRNDAASLERLLGALAVSRRPGDRPLTTVVVDDGSDPPLPAADLRLDPGRGPAAARNAARPLVGDRNGHGLVCFLDADTLPPPGFLDGLLAHFSDPRLGAVAPRVQVTGGTETPAWLTEHERANSPLDLGPDPGVVGAGRRLSYVPTAALVCRLEALDAVGWFDEELQVGEDVELLRRLEEAGWAVRYEPSVVVEHDPRPDLSALLRQRFSYGASAAAIDARHPGSVAPLALTPAAAQVLAATAAVAAGPRRLRPLAAVALAAVLARSGARLRRDLTSLGVEEGEATAEAARLAGRLLAGTLEGALVAARRAWWPLLLLVAIAGGRRTRRRCALVLVAAEAARRPRPSSPGSFGLGLLDDAAYGAGLWAGSLRSRSAGALLPRRSRLRATPTGP